jgi:hypothetical protein
MPRSGQSGPRKRHWSIQSAFTLQTKPTPQRMKVKARLAGRREIRDSSPSAPRPAARISGSGYARAKPSRYRAGRKSQRSLAK